MTKSQRFSRSLFFLLLALSTIAGTLIFSASISKTRQEAQSLKACANPDLLSQSGQFNPQENQAIWLGQTVNPPLREYAQSEEASLLARAQVLGQTSFEKWIDVDLESQRVRAYEGDKVVYEFLTSSGKFAPTPTGEYEIWYKTKYTKMEGGERGTNRYYYLPNVPFTMFFNGPFGLHGTYWHNNFGQPMSHGCLNLSIANAEKLFYWAGPVLPEGESAVRSSSDNPGTKVIVHGTTPRT
ncbi:MAG: L,D-transpeptidase [Candidatus Chisholmbacteria bacterium]|nr:L,D-transpeptidase [Candidatus Chisholmbacteria bacterium]